MATTEVAVPDDPYPKPLAPMPTDMEASALLFAKRTESAKSITPGCEHHILDEWPKRKAELPKPLHVHLINEIARRNSTMRPSSWTAQKCATWLYEHAMGPGPSSSNIPTGIATT